jgi:hypothetical protein
VRLAVLAASRLRVRLAGLAGGAVGTRTLAGDSYAYEQADEENQAHSEGHDESLHFSSSAGAGERGGMRETMSPMARPTSFLVRRSAERMNIHSGC